MQPFTKSVNKGSSKLPIVDYGSGSISCVEHNVGGGQSALRIGNTAAVGDAISVHLRDYKAVCVCVRGRYQTAFENSNNVMLFC